MTGDTVETLNRRAPARLNLAIGVQAAGLSARVSIQSWPAGKGVYVHRYTEAQLLQILLQAAQARIKELAQ